MKELWDSYDKNFIKNEGVVLTRGEIIPDGQFHLVCDIIVKHVDGTYLLMKRDLKKKFGGMWEASACGSALLGETPLDCAKRELFEETGISPISFKELGFETSYVKHTHYVEFFCETDCKKDSVILQKGETIDYKWITYDELLKLSPTVLATNRIQKYIKNE